MPTLINQTPEVPFSNNEYILGEVKKGTTKTVKLLIENAQHSSIKFGCPVCTRAKATQVGDNINLEISYTALGKGIFTKTITETLKDGTQIKIKLIGTDA